MSAERRTRVRRQARPPVAGTVHAERPDEADQASASGQADEFNWADGIEPTGMVGGLRWVGEVGSIGRLSRVGWFGWLHDVGERGCTGGCTDDSRAGGRAGPRGEGRADDHTSCGTDRHTGRHSGARRDDTASGHDEGAPGHAADGGGGLKSRLAGGAHEDRAGGAI